MRDTFDFALDVIDGLRQTTQLHELEALFFSGVSRFGFETYSCLSLTDYSRIDMKRYFRHEKVDYSVVPQDTCMFLQHFPREWADIYWQESYGMIDPILRYGLDRSAPFEWREATTDLSKAQKNFFGAATEFGVADGITVPVNQRGQMPVTINLLGHDFDRSREAKGALYLFALYFQAQAQKLHKGETPGVFKGLTPRQREVLTWASVGKSSDEIGEILSISTDTVNYHVKQAMALYGVHTRMQAVVKAVHFGEIVP